MATLTTNTERSFDTRRYEIKMIVRRSALPQVRFLVMMHPRGFITAYPSRQVNNVYFDTFDLQSLENHVAGAVQRNKIRFRWYGKSVENVRGMLEIKHKRDRLSWKEIAPVDSPIDFTTMSWRDIRDSIRHHIPPGMQISFDSRPEQLFINQYQREYYVAPSNGVRITIDYDIRGYEQRTFFKPQFTAPLLLPDHVIIEFKCIADDYEHLGSVLDHFPLRPVKNSKFVNCVFSFMY